MKAPRWWIRARTPSAAELTLLGAIARGEVERATLFTTYEPHYLDGRDVSRRVRALQLKGLVVLRSPGPAVLSARGASVLNDASTTPLTVLPVAEDAGPDVPPAPCSRPRRLHRGVRRRCSPDPSQ